MITIDLREDPTTPKKAHENKLSYLSSNCHFQVWLLTDSSAATQLNPFTAAESSANK